MEILSKGGFLEGARSSPSGDAEGNWLSAEVVSTGSSPQAHPLFAGHPPPVPEIDCLDQSPKQVLVCSHDLDEVSVIS